MMHDYDFGRMVEIMQATGSTVAEIAENFEAIAKTPEMQFFAKWWVEQHYPEIEKLRKTPEFKAWHKEYMRLHKQKYGY